MTKADIIDRIAHGTGLTKIETEAVVNGFIATVVQALTEGDSVELRGFGSFRAQLRAARIARNPQTKEEVRIEARYVPVFKPSRDFRDTVDDAVKALHREQGVSE
ncbi:MAG: HU family DNA-binding protein [Rhodothermales bacterium]